ncbi:MAG: CPBP family intramembrane metalloprotease [Methanobacteriaceae archaeon]|nr:CPBP family intramembrane metalloprotease [Methanobacteriaceae archaeon]
MSSISFLDNAHEGKNSWWRYLLTSVLSLAGGTLLSGILVATLLVMYSVFLSPGGAADILKVLQTTLSSPFILIVLLGVSYTLSVFLFYICIRFLHHKRFLGIINTLPGLRWKLLLKGLIIWLVIMLLFSLPDLIFNPQSYQVTFNFNGFIILLVLCLLVVPIQASFEEILFRGYLMQGFSLLSEKPWVPLVITSLIFGLVHFFNGTSLMVNLSIVLATFILGMMLGIITLGDNGIETAMGVHIGNNLYVFLIYNSVDSGLPGLPSLYTAQPADPFSGIPFLLMQAFMTITILFWNRKDKITRIFH